MQTVQEGQQLRATGAGVVRLVGPPPPAMDSRKTERKKFKLVLEVNQGSECASEAGEVSDCELSDV